MNNIEQQIQQMVDNQLDDAAYHQLLNTIEHDSPEHWRTLALAHTEAQLIKSSLLGMIEEETQPSQIQPAKHTKKSHSHLYAIAAMLLLGLMLGYFFSPQNTTGNHQTVESDSQLPEPNPRPNEMVTAENQPTQLPVYDYNADNTASARQVLKDSAQFFHYAKDMITQANSKAVSSKAYITTALEDGSEVMIPIIYHANVPNP